MIKAKKKFGQNFLKDDIFTEKIIQSMPKDDLEVVEIGPGLGDLTKKLLRYKKVTAFEIDDDLCQILRSQFSSFIKEGRLELKCVDVLKYWQKEGLIDKEYNLVANLPYYIATKIVLKLLKDDNCRNILAMLQKEVAEKFCAKSNDKEFGYLSIIAELSGDSEILFDVLPESFDPPPKVTSSFLKIKKRNALVGEEGIFADTSELERFERFIRVCFSNPRKTLKKNLSFYGKESISSYFDKLDISLNTRPHQLSSLKYLELFKLIESLQKKVENEREREQKNSAKAAASGSSEKAEKRQ
ncbi:MAG: 16S rRNA (adenine(1518)-N(6)/adenine(1519)-N(6))-dimethyltransferase RsmA [Epsilonproteobacteria bacterium]|nr:16S rRNA (adenine(1518)-N(6)/adenine(1519)-N(6))-dimethyltransferase RsmA [Campylobacterota bacterium]